MLVYTFIDPLCIFEVNQIVFTEKFIETDPGIKQSILLIFSQC